MPSRRRLALAAVFAMVMATVAVAYAQRFGGQRGRGGGRRGGEGGFGRQEAPRRPDANSFTGDFTFCRLAYQQARDYGADGGGWGVDYPRADQNLSIRLSELSKARVNFDASGDPNYYVVIPDDPELFECPFIMMSEFGGTHFDESEAAHLRDYMLKGGFMWVDDSWGESAWSHWVDEVRKIFPDQTAYPIVDVPTTHPMFHSLFDVNKIPQIPSIGRWGGPGGSTSERYDSQVVHSKGIVDAKGRIMMYMTHNTDFGDSYEREGDDPRYFYAFSVDGYAIGIDILMYAMTH
jgi:hypothetical protein